MERLPQRQVLGEFLRRHREATPPDATLLADPHRRAKGLRRSEVAGRVGISEQWYTLLERGRAPNVSAQVLLGLADLFSLSSVETEHLFALAGKPVPEGIRQEDASVPDTLRRFVDVLSPYPGYIIDHHWDALAWNDGAQAILYDLAGAPRRRRNILLQMFTEAYVRERFADWESHAKTVLAFFRRDYGQSPGDPRIREVVAELEQGSEEFRSWWPLQEVEDHVSVRTVYTYPEGIRLEFDRLTFVSAENPNLRVVIFQPAPDSDTEEQVARLVEEDRRRRAAAAGR